MPVCLVSLNLTFVIEEDDFILIEFNLLFGEKHFRFFFCFVREKLMTLHHASCVQYNILQSTVLVDLYTAHIHGGKNKISTGGWEKTQHTIL